MGDVSVGEAFVILFAGLIVGLLIGVLVLVLIPSTHSYLRKKYENLRVMCARRDLEKRSNTEAQNDQQNTNYTEIEEQSNRPRAKHSMKRKADEFKGPTITVNKYEQCTPDSSRTEYGYSAIDSEGGVPEKQAKTGEGYEYVSVQRQLNQKLNAELAKKRNSPIYSILEPGSNKRMPVKMVTDERVDLVSDSNQIYFVLEPGTKKVKPVFQESLKPDADHVYFVLEASEQNTDTEAYAVSDIDPMYFILEKE